MVSGHTVNNKAPLLCPWREGWARHMSNNFIVGFEVTFSENKIIFTKFFAKEFILSRK